MRSDLFERRRRLMDDWATYLAGETLDPEALLNENRDLSKTALLGGGSEGCAA